MTMLDRVMALLAFAAFLAFVGIVAVKVGRIDLTVVIAITVALVLYDGWTQLGPGRRQ